MQSYDRMKCYSQRNGINPLSASYKLRILLLTREIRHYDVISRNENDNLNFSFYLFVSLLNVFRWIMQLMITGTKFWSKITVYAVYYAPIIYLHKQLIHFGKSLYKIHYDYPKYLTMWANLMLSLLLKLFHLEEM